MAEPTKEQEEHYALWAGRAQEQLEIGQAALADERETGDAVLSAMTLATLAYRIALGDVSPDEWPDDDEPECICPPDLVARGGFKGGCPAHG